MDEEAPKSNPSTEPELIGKDAVEARSKLAALYPVPKTYEQRQEEQHQIEAKRAERLPKHLVLTTTLRLYGLVIALLLFVGFLPALIFWNVISGVFLAFLFGLAWVAALGWQWQFLAGVFQVFTLNFATFFTVYCMSLVPLVAISYQLPGGWTLLAVTGIHFTLVAVVIAIMRTHKIASAVKIALLGCIVVISFVLSVLGVTR